MKKILTFFLMFCLLATSAMATDLDMAVEKAGAYLLETVDTPQVGSIGGEWAVIGLARSGYDVPQAYWDAYYQTVVDEVEACDGVLHEKKYTEYARVSLALTAIGADPSDVGGYNLLTPLGDYDKTIWQGINGAIWALIALDSADYSMPLNESAQTQATRQMYIDHILDCQLSDGGWNLTATPDNHSGTSDADVTGMALQALATYQSQTDVATAIEKALTCVSQMQNDQGGFSSWNASNIESTVQVLVGMTALGLDLDDDRFVKADNTVLDNILSFQQENGGFVHTAQGTGDNQMSSEQGYYALVAAQRAQNAQPSLYDMGDVSIAVTGIESPTVGLVGKDDAVQAMPLTRLDVTFPDIGDSDYETTILDLAGRTIINGAVDGYFYPDNTMTRAEFATVVVKSLGLEPKTVEQFTDVADSDWFASYVGTAYSYGIVNGTSDTTFHPQGTITRQEAAVMVARAAKLCGMDTVYDTQTIRDTLAGFMDYVTVSTFAQSSVAFCYDQEILDPWDMDIKPTQAITRGEVAQMLYNLLYVANLL